jgi:hypothetical protein
MEAAAETLAVARDRAVWWAWGVREWAAEHAAVLLPWSIAVCLAVALAVLSVAYVRERARWSERGDGTVPIEMQRVPLQTGAPFPDLHQAYTLAL